MLIARGVGASSAALLSPPAYPLSTDVPPYLCGPGRARAARLLTGQGAATKRSNVTTPFWGTIPNIARLALVRNSPKGPGENQGRPPSSGRSLQLTSRKSVSPSHGGWRKLTRAVSTSRRPRRKRTTGGTGIRAFDLARPYLEDRAEFERVFGGLLYLARQKTARE